VYWSLNLCIISEQYVRTLFLYLPPYTEYDGMQQGNASFLPFNLGVNEGNRKRERIRKSSKRMSHMNVRMFVHVRRGTGGVGRALASEFIGACLFTTYIHIYTSAM